MKVLLVDDDYIALEGLSKMLHWDKFEGQIIGCVSDGLEAISVIQQQVPDVVISDIKMPRMDGIVKCTPKVGQKKFNFRRCIFNVQIHRGIEKANST